MTSLESALQDEFATELGRAISALCCSAKKYAASPSEYNRSTLIHVACCLYHTEREWAFFGLQPDHIYEDIITPRQRLIAAANRYCFWALDGQDLTDELLTAAKEYARP